MTHLVEAASTLEKMVNAIKSIQTEGGPVIFEENGKEVAALIPIEDFRLLERLIEEEEDRLDIEAVRKSREDPGPNTPLSEIKARLGR